MRRKKSLSKFLEPSHKQIVIYTDNPLEFGKHVKISHGITALRHFIDPRQMASLKEPFDDWHAQKGPIPEGDRGRETKCVEESRPKLGKESTRLPGSMTKDVQLSDVETSS